jgi:hypothetical protein
VKGGDEEGEEKRGEEKGGGEAGEERGEEKGGGEEGEEKRGGEGGEEKGGGRGGTMASWQCNRGYYYSKQKYLQIHPFPWHISRKFFTNMQVIITVLRQNVASHNVYVT